MFKTSQPNPNGSNNPNGSEKGANSVGPNQKSGTKPQFKTLEEFSNWLDAQLLNLEAKHDGFQTCESVRKFFSRS